MRLILRTVSGLALLGAVFWIVHSPREFEPYVTAVSMFGGFLATFGGHKSKPSAADVLALEAADQSARETLALLLHEIEEIERQVSFLDVWIWEKQVFTRKQVILDALKGIREFWKRNDERLRGILGADSVAYRVLCGVYDIALQNEHNQPPPDGSGEWRGVTQSNLQGYRIAQAFQYAREELQRKRG
jgi:hypothetical protein